MLSKKVKLQDKFDLSSYLKQKDAATARKRTLEKEIASKQDTWNSVQSYMESRPNDYWENLHLLRGKTLASVYKMFMLPVLRPHTPSKNKNGKRPFRVPEKQESLKQFQGSKAQFDLEF